MRPTRTAAIGVVNGIFDALSANDAAIEREHVGVVLLVGGDDVDEDLDFVLEALGEERADRAIDDARRENLGVARASFALDVAARNLAGGVGLLAVLDEEGEEVERALGRRSP